MGYGHKIYKQAVDIIEKRRLSAISENDRYRAVFFHQCPRAQEIRFEKASDAAKIARIVLSGNDVSGKLSDLKERSIKLDKEFHELCVEHGFDTQHVLLPQFTCKKCGDTGFCDGFMCSCLKELQRNLAYEQLSIHVPLKDCTFDSFSLDYYVGEANTHMRRIFDFCKNYSAKFTDRSSSLIFVGGNGLGKTHISLAIANEVIAKGFGVLYGSAHNLAVSLEKSRFDKSFESNDDDINLQMLGCDLLIIDDLGAEFSSSYVAAAIYNVISTRLLASKPTIISTNLTYRELEKKYSNRFTSRINGGYSQFKFMGADIRNLKRRRKTASQ